MYGASYGPVSDLIATGKVTLRTVREEKSDNTDPGVEEREGAAAEEEQEHQIPEMVGLKGTLSMAVSADDDADDDDADADDNGDDESWEYLSECGSVMSDGSYCLL